MGLIAPVVGRLIGVSAVVTLLLGSLALVTPAKELRPESTRNQVTIDVKGHPLSNITTSPLTLTPAFDPTITDYILRCQAGLNTIQLTFNSIPGGTINVEGTRGQTVTMPETFVENEALIVSANRPQGSRAEDGGEGTEHTSVPIHTEYWIRCLPHDFPQLSVTRPRTPPPGWYLTGNENSVAGSGTYVMVLDNHGTPVWYRKPAGDGAINVTLLPDGTIAWKSNVGPGFEDYNLKTQTTRWLVAPNPPTDLHELHPLPNGDLMVLSYQLRANFDLTTLGLSSTATIIDCVVEEMNPQGLLVWEWRASDHISASESPHPSRTLQGGAVVYDIYHCNSIDAAPLGNVLISSRHTDAVYLIDKMTGEIIWKMGGTPNNHDHSEILRVIGDPQGVFHAQHDARFQPNGDVSLYDDQTWDGSLTSRGVEYHVDTNTATAMLVWSFQASDGGNSAATGSFRRLSHGAGNVIGWGLKRNALFSEVDRDGNALLNMTFPNGEFAYRVIKVAPDALDIGLLRTTAGLPRFVLG